MKYGLTALFVILALVGSAATAAAQDVLLESDWVLETLGGEMPAYQATLSYREGSFAGTTGCNSYSAPVTLDGDALTLAPIITTEMACAQPGAMEQETRFLSALASAARYALDGDQLTIYDGEGTAVMVFTGAGDPLISQHWALRTINGAAVPEAAAITAQFDGTRVAGSAGCNRYTASYTRDGESLAMGMAAATRMFCGQPGVMEREAAFLAALASVVRYEVRGGDLALMDAEGNDVLVFAGQSEAALSGTAWRLAALNGESLSDSAITLQFEEQGLGGSGGCNSYGADYRLNGRRLAIAPVISTMMACAELIMTQESAYFAALEASVMWELDGEQLRLLNADGVEVLRFTLAVAGM